MEYEAEAQMPTTTDIRQALASGWKIIQFQPGAQHYLVKPEDKSYRWCTKWFEFTWSDVDIRVPGYLRRRMNEIQAEVKQAQETQAEQAKDNPLYTKSFLAAASQHSTAVAWCSSEDCAGGELVEQGTPSNLQEVESSLSGLRSPCERG